jgi:hypothetical protein
MQTPDQSQMPEMLATVTDTMLAGKNIDAVLHVYGVSKRQIADFLNIITVLQRALVGVKPSRRFTHRLKQDLMGTPRMNVITRIRYLPPRVQIAAGVALMAGFALLLRRRALNDGVIVVREAETTA